MQYKGEYIMFKICIDPGHGGNDPGAVGPSGLKEKDVVLKISLILRDILKAKGFIVECTRTEDVSLANTINEDLNARVNIANQLKSDYFISIHCNSSTNRTAHGVETYALAAGGQAEKLAQAVQRRLTIETGRANRGVKFANFLVLRKTNMPAILVETAFISNYEEENLLKAPFFIDGVANAVAGGIFDFLGIKMGVEIMTVQEAVNILVEKDVINSPDYWLKAADVVKHLDTLLINMANKLT